MRPVRVAVAGSVDDVTAPSPVAHPVSTPAVQRSKKPLFTLTGLFFESNEMFSGVPLLKPFALR